VSSGRKIWGALPILAMSGMFLVACGDSNPGAGNDGGAGAGGTSSGGTGGTSSGGAGGTASGGHGGTAAGGAAGTSAGGAAGTAAGGAAGTSAGGHGGTAAGGAAGTSSGGHGGTAAGGAAGASAGGAAGTSAGGAAGTSAGGHGGTSSGTGGAITTDAATPSDAHDAGTDTPVPFPATTIPTSPIDFQLVDCGSAGGTRTLTFSNTGTASLHFRGSIGSGGLFSLQGALADGSVSGDVMPGGSATLTVVAGVVPTSTAAGAVLQGVLSVTTNAAGADNTQVPITMTAQGSTCTLTCGSFAKCTPSNASPYCANTATDNSNCGTCGTACGVGEVCTSGVCSLTCGALTKCSPTGGADYCANTQTDSANCGTCGTACTTGQVCNSGVCTLSCGALTKCSPSSGAPYCANTATDNVNCGTCGNTCPTGQVCTAGVCTITCGSQSTCTPTGSAAYCANLATDNFNCGACGVTCSSGKVCTSGVCAITCGSLSTCMPSSGAAYCANLATDNSNCGTCGTACPMGQACISSVCTPTCSGSETICSAQCTNTSFDPSNCGHCGTVCGFPQGSAACSGGACFLTSCSAGFLDCNHVQTDGCEVNKMTDALNCGACGASCALGETCNAGVCTANLAQGFLGYWKMDDAFGSTSALDSGPNHLNGLVQGPVTFVPGAGKQGSGAISLAGNGYLKVQFPNDALNEGTGISIPQGNITFAMWFQTSASSAGGLQVIEGSASHSGCDRVIGNGGGPTLQYNDWSEVNMSGAKSVNDGAWHQVTYVMDETNGLKAYIDGVLDVSSTTPTSNCGVGCSGFNWAVQYWIGRSAGCRFGADFFVGLIDDVRMYDHVLSPAAVLQLYNATK